MADEQDKVWVGFDLGGTKMLAVLFDHEMKPIGRKRRKTKAEANRAMEPIPEWSV